MRQYSFWLKAAVIVQFTAAVIHAITLFVTVPPSNETEKQLFILMDTYKLDFGAGFHRTMADLVFTLSACYCLVCVLACWLNWYLLRKKIEPAIMKGVITINLVVFGILFALTVMFAFLLPIILTGFIFLCLLFSRLALQRL